MQKSLESFYKALRNVETVLANHKSTAISHEQEIRSILTDTDRNLAKAAKTKINATGLQQQMTRALEVLQDSIGASYQAMEEKSQIRKRLEEVDEQVRAKVIVFGRTNAGKSTLGNFLRSKILKDAPFDNPWKNGAIKIEPIKVIEKAGEEERETREEREWFAEGSTETTQEIQTFTLPGLLWVDTPGIGSINDEKLGELARNYSDNADMVIYLDLSDNPGLRSLSKSLINLLQLGKETLCVINQSDKNSLAKDVNGKTIFENGKPKQIRMPKPEADRRAQEQQLIKSLRDQGFKPNVNLDAISISMLLAKMAVENNDAKLYEGSAFGKFLKKLEEVFSSPHRINKIMAGHLYSACLDLCNMALNGPRADVPGINEQINGQQQFLDKIKALEADFDIEAATREIAAKVSIETGGKLQRFLDDAMSKAEQSKAKNFALDLGPLQEQIQKLCNRLVGEKVREVVKDLFGSVEFKNITLAASKLNNFSLERKSETHEYEVPDYYRRRRDPEGFWEHIGSWFGKEYYTVERKYVKKTQTIDLGFNKEEIRGQIKSQIDRLIPEQVYQSLEDAKKESLGYAREKVEETLNALINAMEKLTGVQKRIEKEMRAAGN